MGSQLNQSEVIYFAQYLVEQIKPIPWSLNSLDHYYVTKDCHWITGGKTFNKSLVLERIMDVM